jgi:hypothetical protein
VELRRLRALLCGWYKWSDVDVGHMTYDRGLFFSSEADSQRRAEYRWMGSAASVPYMETPERRAWFDRLKNDDERRTVRVGTEEGAIKRAKEMLEDGF